MAQDPAFLFYYKDFDNDTADWESHAIGWYVRLLIFQAGNGYIPSEKESIAQVARVRFSEFESFQNIWALRLASKFITLSEGKLFNKKLAKIQAERKSGAIKKSVLAVFGNYIKSSKLNPSEERAIKKVFNKGVDFYGIPDAEKRKKIIHDFLNNELNNIQQRSAKRTQQGDVNENEDVIIDKKEKGGLGEKTAYEILNQKHPIWIEQFEMKHKKKVPNWETFLTNFEYAVENEEIDIDRTSLIKKRLEKLIANWNINSPVKNQTSDQTKTEAKLSKYD